jgi:hypothetical protein
MTEVRRAAAETHRGVVAQCPGMRLAVRVPVVRAIASPRPTLTFRCDLDCTYVLTVSRAGTVVKRTGTAVGNVDKRVLLGRLKPGTYLVRLDVTATVNPGPTRTVTSRLVVPKK